ncbi:large ribosomal subunit protein mL64 [Conger conger]|uniref:large ribosomal subunit protein mL64 n=1 Tax=Conger conger TaxID=82655 RepID=UPI002A59BEAB|nr:large ribosomal subunit protein mL64 [Conger conger]
MAASVLCRRLALSGVLRGVSVTKSLSPGISQCGSLLQTANYNPKPLKLNLNDLYIPDKGSEKTPEWQKTTRYDRKLFGRYGSASGIDTAKLWPRSGELGALIAEEKEWHPSLEEILANVTAKKNEEEKKRLIREKRIATNMANMPKMVAAWRREKSEVKAKKKEEKARRDLLLAEARARYGYALDPRSTKFKEMLSEIEKEDAKKRKVLKRRKKEEQRAAATVTAAPTT